MGAACATCRDGAIDVIPDREVMLGVVETIVQFEQMLKQGQTLSKAETKQLRAVTKEMAKLGKATGKVTQFSELQ